LLIVGAFPDAVPPVAAVYHCNVLPVEAVAVQTGAVLFSQKSAGFVPVGALGLAITVVVNCNLGPSQPPLLVFWLTQTFLVPEGVLVIVGDVLDAVPFVAVVYHCNVLPVEAVAVQTGAVLFSQKLAGLAAVGALGLAITVVVNCNLGPSQPPLIVF
jgi:preprotein translocase subunit Sss1